MSFSLACFPGQGAQKPGMGKSIYENSEAAKLIFEQAGDAAGMDVAALCFDSEAAVLSRTENAQIAIFTHSLAVKAAMEEAGLPGFAACAGFSLGEYTALAASDAVSFADGIRLVKKRGELMQQAADGESGGMYAILGLADEAVEEILSEVSDVYPVNYNCPGQIVIAGRAQALETAVEKLKAAGAKRALPLQVSGAFHTPLMQEAAAELREYAKSTSFSTPSIPVYTNVTGGLLETVDMPEHLYRHMISPVRWTHLIETCLKNGLHTGAEIGPGKTLTGFARKISKELVFTAAETMEDVLFSKNQ